MYLNKKKKDKNYEITWYFADNKTDIMQHVLKSKKKVKCTLVQALRLCTGRTAHRGSRGIALLFLDHSTRRG